MEIVQSLTLVKAGAYVNVSDQYSCSPLMLALDEDHNQCVNELIKSGDNLNAIYEYDNKYHT